ncbi:transketolase [Gemmatimonadetes bacterium T265]|nr:transketolase [Gemmatimonadetes bacterium T265]
MTAPAAPAPAAPAAPDDADLTALSINALRLLSVDMIQQANSGHPGLPMGAAPMAYALWTRFLRFNPRDPQWPDRDRFVLSAGHGSALLYSLLHLTGYDLPMEQIKRFRQWGSATPGHPERGHHTPGVELSTGPLGQGFANGVGMAMAEAWLAARYNRPGHTVVDHHTYALVSDGDLMEGVTQEAASLAGHLQLGKLVYLYDQNHITLAGQSSLTYTEDVAKRFDAYGWHTRTVPDGNDVEDVAAAIAEARAETRRPSLILVQTQIGYGSPKKQGTYHVHGSPLGPDEVTATKAALGWPSQEPFYLPPEVVERFRRAVPAGQAAQAEWQARMDAYAAAFPDEAAELTRAWRGELPAGWADGLPTWDAGSKPVSTRVAGGQVLNALAKTVHNIVGGSADLNPSTNTAMTGGGDFQPSLGAGAAAAVTDAHVQGAVGGAWGYAGRNMAFGIREHAMGAAVNGMAAHGGVIPFAATFFVFSDYLKPSLRLAALSELHAVYVFTHDSIAVGEDGPTHEPVEQLAGLRAIPQLVTIRPADANETAEAWAVAVARPSVTALVLSRQNLPILDRSGARDAGVAKGGYVLADAAGGAPEVLLIGTGSEVALCVDARERLTGYGVRARVVSLPSWELFAQQSAEYREQVLPDAVRARVAVEAAASLGWERFVGMDGAIVALDRYGASAPGEEVMRRLGFTAERVTAAALRQLGRDADAAKEEAGSQEDGQTAVAPTPSPAGHS